MAECYHASVLTVDQVILDAIATGSSEAAALARECCAEAGHSVYLETSRTREFDVIEGKPPDTVEVPFQDEIRKTSVMGELQPEVPNISESKCDCSS